MTEHEAVAALEAFVVDNDDLLELEATVGRFNVFDALGIARQEIRHSNFLAFLLDPDESHGQSQTFLTAVLMDLLKSTPPSLRPLSPIELDGVDLQGVEVRRESNRIDLLIACRSPAFVVAVENKVDSGEHDDQLSRYRDAVKAGFPGVPALLVYLTPEGDEASEADWVPYSYRDLHRVLSRVRASHAGSIGEDVRVFLDHYLNLIGTRFMDDRRIDELCRRIWKNHRLALQLIHERVGTPGSRLLAQVEDVVRSDPFWFCFNRAGGVVDFIPATWRGWLPTIGTDSKEHPQSWFTLRFQIYKNQLEYWAEVRRMNDLVLRRSIIDGLLPHMRQLGFPEPKPKKGVPTDQYTRVSGKEVLLKWADEQEPSEGAVADAVRRKLEQVAPPMDTLGPTFRSLVEGCPAADVIPSSA